MNQEFIVNGTDIPPSVSVENSIFQNTQGILFRYISGEWVRIGDNNEASDK